MDKSRETEGSWRLPKEAGDREQLANGYRIFFRRDESVLDGGGGCTTSQIYQSVHFKMIFMFM